MTSYQDWERRQRQADHTKRIVWLCIAAGLFILLVRLLSGCAPEPECPSDAPLRCYLQNESQRTVCCPTDAPYACIGTTYCARDARLCPSTAFFCDTLDAEPTR